MSTFDRRRTREEAEPFVKEALAIVDDLSPAMFDAVMPQQVEVCGTWRRGIDSIGDIDLMIVSETSLATYAWPEWMSVSARRTQGWMVDVDEERMMFDAFWCPPGSEGAMALFLTGPPQLNIRMRKKAEARGWLLNQYGLFVAEESVTPGGKVKTTPGERVDQPVGDWADDERVILTMLGMSSLTPAERETY